MLPNVHNSLSAEVHQAQFIHAHKHKTHVNNRHIHLSMICVFLLFLRGKNGLALNAAFGHNTNCCCLKRAGSAHRLELKSHLLKKIKTTRGGQLHKTCQSMRLSDCSAWWLVSKTYMKMYCFAYTEP